MKFIINNVNVELVKNYVKAMLQKMKIEEVPEIINGENSNIEIEDYYLYNKKDGASYIRYKTFLMLHILSEEDANIIAVCYAIEIMEELENQGWDIWEKGIYQGAFSKIN